MTTETTTTTTTIQTKPVVTSESCKDSRRDCPQLAQQGKPREFNSLNCSEKLQAEVKICTLRPDQPIFLTDNKWPRKNEAQLTACRFLLRTKLYHRRRLTEGTAVQTIASFPRRSSDRGIHCLVYFLVYTPFSSRGKRSSAHMHSVSTLFFSFRNRRAISQTSCDPSLCNNFISIGKKYIITKKTQKCWVAVCDKASGRQIFNLLSA